MPWGQIMKLWLVNDNETACNTVYATQWVDWRVEWHHCYAGIGFNEIFPIVKQLLSLSISCCPVASPLRADSFHASLISFWNSCSTLLLLEKKYRAAATLVIECFISLPPAFISESVLNPVHVPRLHCHGYTIR